MKLLGRILMAVFLVNIVAMTHELGHFAAAEYFGFPADTISLGFGPKIYSFEIRPGLEGRLSAIPLGGYVQFGEKAIARAKLAPDWQGVVLFGAGVTVNWLSPILVLLIFSKRYRRLDSQRARFPLTGSETYINPNNFFWRIPIVSGTVFYFWSLMRPLGDEGLREEWAWKYTDFARAVGYFNLIPIVGLDGKGIYACLISMAHIRQGSALDWLICVSLIFLLFMSARQTTYRKLL